MEVTENKNKRIIVDCQYFKETDILVIHEILNGKRNYIIVNNPSFTFYIARDGTAPQQYYTEIDKLEKHTCKYKDRFFYVNRELEMGYTDRQLFEYSTTSKINRDPRLHFFDNSVEFQYIFQYNEKFKDEIDETIESKILSFDIEVHGDFPYPVYVELLKIQEYFIENKDIDFEPDSSIDLFYFENMRNEKDMKQLKELITNYTIEAEERSYLDLRYLIAISHNKNITDGVKKFILGEMEKGIEKLKNNLGFPQEELARSRIDAISFYDNIENKAYMYMLKIPEDLRPQDEEYIKSDLHKQRLLNFMILFNTNIYLNNNKIEFEEEEKNNSFANLKERFIAIYKRKNDEEIETNLQSLLEELKNYISEEQINKLCSTKLVFRIFEKELDMITKFFTVIREDIQPNICLAHNAKFDILTLQNRLIHYKKDPVKFFSQLPEVKANLYFKIDFNAKATKQNKTSYRVPGIVFLDSLLVYAKTQQKEREFGLDVLAKDELKESKIIYDGNIFELYARNIEIFIKYSIIDTMLVNKLEEKLKFVTLFQNLLRLSFSNWQIYCLKTLYITNMIKASLYNKGFVLRNNQNDMADKNVYVPEDDDDDEEESENESSSKKKEAGYRGAYVTDLLACKTYGFHEDVYDLDFSAFYPSAMISTHIFPDTLVATFKDREVYQSFLFEQPIVFCNKYLGTDSIESIFEEL